MRIGTPRRNYPYITGRKGPVAKQGTRNTEHREHKLIKAYFTLSSCRCSLFCIYDTYMYSITKQLMKHSIVVVTIADFFDSPSHLFRVLFVFRIPLFLKCWNITITGIPLCLNFSDWRLLLYLTMEQRYQTNNTLQQFTIFTHDTGLIIIVLLFLYILKNSSFFF